MANSPNPAPPARSSRITGRILVVEPDELVRRMLAMSLHEQGHVVLTAEDIPTAENELSDQDFDLILLDTDAEVASRYALLDWLKSNEILTPVIVASARDKTRQVVRAFERGAADYLTKPINLSVMSARVAAVLSLMADPDGSRAQLRPLEALRNLDLPAIDDQLEHAASGGASMLLAVNDILRDALDAERASVFRYDADRHELLTVVAHGDGQDGSPLIRMNAEEGLAGASLRLNRMLNIPDAYQDERFNQEFDQQTGFRTRSVLCFPLHDSHGETIGVAQVLNHRQGGFSVESEIIASQLASRCANALAIAFFQESNEVNLAATIIAESPIVPDDTIVVSPDPVGHPVIVPDPSRPESMIDATLGRYHLQSILGSGMQGVVFQATDELLARDVAIKLLGLHSGRTDHVRNQFMHEARVMAQLEHNHTVSIYDVGEYEGSMFLVMELCDQTTGTLISENADVPYPRCLTIIRDACMGLSAAHKRGMIHRDIKPDNILITSDGVGKLSDFGLAMAANTTDMSGDNRIVGTPHYMSPEQARAQSVDHRSDIYALGSTFFHLVTGQAPFGSYSTIQDVLRAHCVEPIPDPCELQPDLPRDCETVIRICMAKQPADRYQTATALLEDIQALLDRTDLD
ncbi:MAG: protein kinase [Phycisphaerales bacterium]|nr:protein kinase [Phycisphaerales bacterium]